MVKSGMFLPIQPMQIESYPRICERSRASELYIQAVQFSIHARNMYVATDKISNPIKYKEEFLNFCGEESATTHLRFHVRDHTMYVDCPAHFYNRPLFPVTLKYIETEYNQSTENQPSLSAI